MQDAEAYFTQAPSKEWWADHSWANVFMGGSALMWQETGDAEYALRARPT